MKTNSFRLKIASLSALVSGGLLLVAGAVLWERTYQVELARIDREIRNLGTPHLERVVGGDHWVRFEGALRFSADASHELKTPLTILQGELEQAIQAAEPGSETQRAYSRLLDEIVHLRAIADKLLLLSQADAGRLPLRRERVDLSRVLADVIEDVHALGLELTVESEIEPNVFVQADSDLIQRVLQNLAANAVKFNRDGGRVRLELHREGDNAVFRIANTGPVIPLADRERIFERFYRTAQARDSLAGGVGLGLSLAREILRAHNGDITLELARDDLTEFVVCLPLSRE